MVLPWSSLFLLISGFINPRIFRTYSTGIPRVPPYHSRFIGSRHSTCRRLQLPNTRPKKKGQFPRNWPGICIARYTTASGRLRDDDKKKGGLHGHHHHHWTRRTHSSKKQQREIAKPSLFRSGAKPVSTPWPGTPLDRIRRDGHQMERRWSTLNTSQEMPSLGPSYPRRCKRCKRCKRRSKIRNKCIRRPKLMRT
ncbi:hypothetical protein B0H65DRAFT_460561 [Neurospora tetraspora]|uniref:Secreted protein n=1 Tax=Neurospora tetraspora TaxID=94610 RepID=A0AAE0MSS6_9PEZI|nr:hypothetical protein B0H65DRAFT_460561 [Neurospora tetraspora]